jgi:hypothetical protein
MDLLIIDLYIGAPNKEFLLRPHIDYIDYVIECSNDNSFIFLLVIINYIIITDFGSPIMVNVFPQPNMIIISSNLSAHKRRLSHYTLPPRSPLVGKQSFHK